MYKMGKVGGLLSAIIINVILVSTFGAKLILLFGFATNVANGFYACIFFATAILTEYYGRKVAYSAVLLGFSSLVLFVFMSQFIIQSIGVPQSQAFSNATWVVFTAVPRIALASMIAYLAAQNFNVWFYALLKDKMYSRLLWLRSIISIMLAEVIDSILFFSIAFFGIVSPQMLIQAMVVGFSVKLIVSIMSTPFLYAAPLFEVRENSQSS